MRFNISKTPCTFSVIEVEIRILYPNFIKGTYWNNFSEHEINLEYFHSTHMKPLLLSFFFFFLSFFFFSFSFLLLFFEYQTNRGVTRQKVGMLATSRIISGQRRLLRRPARGFHLASKGHFLLGFSPLCALSLAGSLALRGSAVIVCGALASVSTFTPVSPLPGCGV